MNLFANCCFPATQSQNLNRGQILQCVNKIEKSHSNQPQETIQKINSPTNLLSEPPLKIKLIQSLGLKDLFVQQLIFARRKSTYKLLQTIKKQPKFAFRSVEFTELEGYEQVCNLIETQKCFIPVIHFVKKLKASHELADEYYPKGLMDSNLTMIFSHGNSADLQYCYQIVHMMIIKYPVNFIIYDYTGYGNQCKPSQSVFKQQQHQLSGQSICRDLKQVIKWANVPYQNVILWGFSLGCYPSIKLATQIKVNRLVLQAPFASIFHFIENQMDDVNQHSEHKIFKDDMFNNLELVSKINCDALLIHSQDDEIIPIRHSRMLLNTFNKSKNKHHMRLIELGGIKHNQMHSVLCAQKRNQIQLELYQYLIEGAISAKEDNKNRDKKQKFLNKITKRMDKENANGMNFCQEDDQNQASTGQYDKQRSNQSQIWSKSNRNNNKNHNQQNKNQSKLFQLNETHVPKKASKYLLQSGYL